MVSSRTSGLRRATLFSVGGAGIYGISLILMDVAIAHRYGTGTQAAVYQAAYMIPTLLIGMFSGGAVLGAFVPIFIRLGGQSRQAAADLFLRSTAGLLLTILTPLAALLIWAAPLLAETIASGFSLAERKELINTLRLMLPMLVPHAVAYVYYSALVSIGRVGAANTGPLLIPAVGMATFPWWNDHNGAPLIAVGYLVGSILLAVMTGWRLRLDGFRVTPALSTRSPESGVFLRDYLTTGMALATLAVLLLVSQVFAASLSARDLAAFSYGTKLVLLALAFLTTIINSVALPHFSSLVASVGRLETWLHLRQLTIRVFVLASIGSLLWILLSGWIVSIVYARGEFNDADAALVANVQRAFVLQIPFYVVGILCWRMLNVLREWKPLLLATFPALMFNIGVISKLTSDYHVIGIAGSYTLSIAIWALILFVALRNRLTSLSH